MKKQEKIKVTPLKNKPLFTEFINSIEYLALFEIAKKHEKEFFSLLKRYTKNYTKKLSNLLQEEYENFLNKSFTIEEIDDDLKESFKADFVIKMNYSTYLVKNDLKK